MVKYRDTFAQGRGVAWDKAKTVNEQRGIEMTDVKKYLAGLEVRLGGGEDKSLSELESLMKLFGSVAIGGGVFHRYAIGRPDDSLACRGQSSRPRTNTPPDDIMSAPSLAVTALFQMPLPSSSSLSSLVRAFSVEHATRLRF
ncbi:hypothetical protein NM208_g17098 [Fusarium decemcellulare]|uniref:Uncharacterized protein n=1 Tax=Fusarium decemcellulare TaxID=57161 RepID=A0ACC1R8F1_9HYPO|nr:hypothetical protein NM208_g17098 [Fusarium decemcellulare]